jgi:hypothetical protein
MADELFTYVPKEWDTITIPMKEYKELLIIKGKYEELKEQQIQKLNYQVNRNLTNNDLKEFSAKQVPNINY